MHENTTPDSFLGELIAYVGGHDCTMQGIFDLFRKHSKDVVIGNAMDDEFDTAGDEYYYCFKDEGCHIIYHRFLPEDYRDMF